VEAGAPTEESFRARHVASVTTPPLAESRCATHHLRAGQHPSLLRTTAAPTPMDHNYYVYILASTNRVLYIGMTNDLLFRIGQHKQRLIPGFTKRYNVERLVYYEHTHDVQAAIAREKQIKGWVRKKKVSLIESLNPEWVDLYPELLRVSDG
jgi:putative endonuclease